MSIGFNLQSFLTPNTNINYGIDQSANLSVGKNMALMSLLSMPGIGGGDSIPYAMGGPITLNPFFCGGLGFGNPYSSIFMNGGFGGNSMQSWQNLGNTLGTALSTPFFKLGDAIESLFCKTA